jgi:hypothetical protein
LGSESSVAPRKAVNDACPSLRPSIWPSG